jgi:hypothetical protein
MPCCLQRYFVTLVNVPPKDSRVTPNSHTFSKSPVFFTWEFTFQFSKVRLKLRFHVSSLGISVTFVLVLRIAGFGAPPQTRKCKVSCFAVAGAASPDTILI